MRYSDREGHVRFDDFVSCYIKLKSVMSERLSRSSVFLSKLMLIAAFRKEEHLSLSEALTEKQTRQNTNSTFGIKRCC